jgi:hypothetical protein
MSPADTGGKGFFGSLFDLTFQHYVIPKLLKVIYVIVIVLSGLAALVWVGLAFKENPILGILVLLVVAPLYFIFNIILWRVFIELVMSWFNAVRSLDTIAKSVVVMTGSGAVPVGVGPPPAAWGAAAPTPQPVDHLTPTPVPRRCTNCSADIRPGSNFCETCGTPA